MKVLFAHGFEGVPNGRKPRFLREALGYEVIAPHMYANGWRFEDQVQVLLDALDADPDIRLAVGSSMGGFAMAAAVARRPERDLRVLLMAPAVGLHQVWSEQLGDEAMSMWAEMGSLQYYHQGVGREVLLPYALWTQCRDAAEVVLTHPTIIIHGLHDETVPVENAVALAKRSPGVTTLYAVADGHRLLDSLPLMADAARRLAET